MGKLVRDKIPQIITDAGKKSITEILDQERYLEELFWEFSVKNENELYSHI